MTSDNGISYGDDSPIAAFSTAVGNGALSLIRCSGKGSIELISSVFTPQKIKEASGNTIIHGWIINGGEKIDEVLVSVFRSPKSYTGEDSVDISCHGGFTTGRAVLNTLKSAGFRDALPGEFTFRAFMNGKLDLTKSESVMELVSAKTEAGRRHALTRLSGSLLEEINEIKKLLVKVLVGAEIYLDYSEDEISAANDEEISGRLPEKESALLVLERLRKLSASWKLERLYQEGATVVIAGSPNTGKSSLFNCLLKEDRSIVAETPGTTRDWIEAWISIKGIPVRLVDTAGLRETGDTAEKIGIERSRSLIDEADLVLYLLNGDCYPQNSVKNLFVWSKSDITPPPPDNKLNPVCVSAKTGEGIPELVELISGVISRQVQQNTYVSVSVGTERQKKLVDAACSYMEEALALSDNEQPLDLIAPLLREAVNALGEITGEISTSDILEEMFSRFCVGK
ncbi:MAG: tRNA uridine-5-carboxymethylaminomethyl(34) synthesis GTPase MnmE [Treponema sp.]|nr:tRNA uridine-5-carboxymethylaminomethyl(34) synthesis GTPase MnmE [Treponema sp.]MCL2272451.1 tRNA uridine-5-carboxymethylaminomethyl(34) synthesis GTPase MnmE [Treponema sp.]